MVACCDLSHSRMNAFFHALHIATLAMWLSVASFGIVNVTLPEWRAGPADTQEFDSALIQENFTLGDEGNSAATEDPQPIVAVPITAPFATPPELPDLSPSVPLPEIPDGPIPLSPPSQPTVRPIPSKLATHPKSLPTPSGPIEARNGVANQARIEKSVATGSGLSDSARLAAGRKPKPNYPGEAKRKHQTGTVIVQFTVDARGRVISAFVQSSSPWPLLNDEAIRTVRRWTFPPGAVMTKTQPIIFSLQ